MLVLGTFSSTELTAGFLQKCRSLVVQTLVSAPTREKLRQAKALAENLARMQAVLEEAGCETQPESDEGFVPVYHPLTRKYGFGSIRRGRKEILSVKRGIESSRASPFLKHVSTYHRLRQIHELGGRLVVDPSLVGGAYFSWADDTIYLPPDAPFWWLDHEFAHLVDKRSKELRNGVASLPAELSREFQTVFELIAALRAETRFSPVTLAEIFAALHEKRLKTVEPTLNLIRPGDPYLLSYIAHDLRGIPSSQLSPLELFFWKMLPTETSINTSTDDATGPKARSWGRAWATGAGLVALSLYINLVAESTLHHAATISSVESRGAKLAQKLMDSSGHPGWKLSQIEVVRSAGHQARNPHDYHLRTPQIIVSFHSPSGEVATGKMEAENYQLNDKSWVLRLSRQPQARTFELVSAGFSMVIHPGSGGAFVQNGALGVGEGATTVVLPAEADVVIEP